MVASSFLTEIQLSYNQFTKTEKKIADYVIKNAEQVLFMSISDFSDACRVAYASVYRFCRTAGLKGYQEFKMKLSLSLSNDDSAEKAKGDSAPQYMGLDYILDGILETNINTLKETRRLADFDSISEVVTMMKEAKRIYFFGVGDSLLVAQIARNVFLRITNKVFCVEDPHMQAMTASMATEEDLIIILSYSGSTKDNVYVANIAKEAGAKVVAISRFLKSPLTSYTDVLLLCGSNEGPLEGGAMGTKMSQMFVIDVLFHEYYRRNHEDSKTNNRKTSRAVVEKLY